MIFSETKIEGAFVIEPQQIGDDRGFFARVWCQKEFLEHGLDTDFVQANISFNASEGTLRGMHYQVAPHREVKLVRCTRGVIYDVIVDLRRDSPSYGEWLGLELTADNYKMLYVPQGCAHGYLTLSDAAEVAYQVSEFYAPAAERGIRWDDPWANIAWPGTTRRIISDKDAGWPDYEEA